MFLLLFFLTALADDFLISGLNSDFRVVSKIYGCDYFDYSCNNIMCLMLRDKYISYVSLTPRVNNPNCSQIPLSKLVNMNVFGMDEYGKLTEPIVCRTTSDCLMKGCQMYKYPIYTWPMYNGSCWKN
jgi:hypothetical protein